MYSSKQNLFLSLWDEDVFLFLPEMNSEGVLTRTRYSSIEWAFSWSPTRGRSSPEKDSLMLKSVGAQDDDKCLIVWELRV